MPNNNISVTIIAKNEAKDIGNCLDAIADWADEIIVLDSGSTDGTQEICRKYANLKLVETDWPGFGPQKNRALRMATKKWVLSLDADEVVTPELRDEILDVIKENKVEFGYKIRRRNFYLGKEIKHFTQWMKDPNPLRFGIREKLQFTDDSVHESMRFDGEICLLKNAMLHYTYSSIEEIIHKMNLYSTLVAQKKIKLGKRSSLTKAIFVLIRNFLSGYFKKLAFMDGKEGFILALFYALERFFRQLKIYYGNNGDKKK